MGFPSTEVKLVVMFGMTGFSSRDRNASGEGTGGTGGKGFLNALIFLVGLVVATGGLWWFPL